MKEQQDYLKDISEIKKLMEKSTRFLSLSGLSGVLIGMYALAGVAIAHFTMGYSAALERGIMEDGLKNNRDISDLIILAIAILILSLGTGYWFSHQKSVTTGQKIWNPASRTMMWHFGVPLATGGCVMLILLSRGMIDWLAPASLLFYGLALYSISRFTFAELKGLSLLELSLGLLGMAFPTYGLWLWALGFGVGHIIYGFYIYQKHEK